MFGSYTLTIQFSPLVEHSGFHSKTPVTSSVVPEVAIPEPEQVKIGSGNQDAQAVNDPIVTATNLSRSTKSSVPPSQTNKRNDTRPKIKIALKRGNGVDWMATSVNQSGNSAEVGDVTTQQNASNASTVAGNVSSFLNGIRASWRQDNVLADNNQRSKKSN